MSVGMNEKYSTPSTWRGFDPPLAAGVDFDCGAHTGQHQAVSGSKTRARRLLLITSLVQLLVDDIGVPYFLAGYHGSDIRVDPLISLGILLSVRFSYSGEFNQRIPEESGKCHLCRLNIAMSAFGPSLITSNERARLVGVIFTKI